MYEAITPTDLRKTKRNGKEEEGGEGWGDRG